MNATVRLRYLLAGLTAAEVQAARGPLALELSVLSTITTCVADSTVEAEPEGRALVVQVEVRRAVGEDALSLARSAVLAAAHQALLPIKEVPGTHRLVEATPAGQ